MSLALQAGLWGLVGGSALLLGAGLAFLIRLPQRLIAATTPIAAGAILAMLVATMIPEATEEAHEFPV